MKHLVNSALRSVLGLSVIRSASLDELMRDQALLQRELKLRGDTLGELRQQARGALLIYGNWMQYDPLDEGMQLHSLAGSTEPAGEIAFICNQLKPGQTVLDIGANVGLVALPMAKAVGERGQVIAFEPGPRAFRFLQLNRDLNSLAQLKLENVAVADKEGQAELLVAMTGESDNRLGHVHAADTRYRGRVRTITIDGYLKGRPVDFIKMDVQGSEYVALLGMQETVRASPGVQIVMEYGPGWLESAGVAFGDFFDLIDRLGLKTFDIVDDVRPVPVDRAWIARNIDGQDRVATNLLLRRQ